jgi:hypothetical protein
MKPMDDAELLQTLTTALAPEPVQPGPGQLAALHQALATRQDVVVAETDNVRATAGACAEVTPLWLARANRLRHPAAALIAAAVLATGGVAAAAVATNTLPGPTRVVAFDLGLPVSSPALVVAQREIVVLRVDLAQRNGAAVAIATASVRADVARLSASDRRQVEPDAGRLLIEADSFLDATRTPDDGADGGSPSHSDGPGSAPSGPGRSPGGSSDGPGDDQGSAPTTAPDRSGHGPDGGSASSGSGSPAPGSTGTDGGDKGTGTDGGGSGSPSGAQGGSPGGSSGGQSSAPGGPGGGGSTDSGSSGGTSGSGQSSGGSGDSGDTHHDSGGQHDIDPSDDALH